VRQQVVPQIKLPQRQQDPLFYRAEPAKAVFAAGFRVHPQKVTVGVATEIHIDERRAEVEQKLSYAVAFKPVDRLTLDVPHAAVGLEEFSILFEGKPLQPVDLPDPNDQPDLAGPGAEAGVVARRADRCLRARDPLRPPTWKN